MVIAINSNIASLRAQRRLTENTGLLRTSFERLSSGQRINRASDDAAGLAISSSLRSDSRIFGQGMRNINDGLGALNIAEGSLQQQSSILIRMRELATQASNGSFSTQQRNTLSVEAAQLSAEYNRIINTSSFNGLKLLDRSLSNLGIQAGFSTMNISIGSQLSRSVGNGTYGTAMDYSDLGANSESQTKIVDINGDGKQDLITVGKSGAPFGAGQAQVGVALGNGDGTFNSAMTYNLTASAASTNLPELEIKDLNGDGKLDLVVGGRETNKAMFGVLIGAGDGTFSSIATYSVGAASSRIYSLALADLNGDSKLDLVYGGENDSAFGEINVLLGNGDGTFGARTSYQLGSNSASSVSQLMVADTDNNGALDIVAFGTNDSSQSEFNIFKGGGNGTFSGRTSQAAGVTINAVELGDINDDGYLDLVAVGSSNGLFVYNGRADGTFNTATSYATDKTFHGLKLVDLNGDGIEDIATTSSACFGLFLGNSDGSFGYAETDLGISNINGATSINFGDMNGDGALDLILSDAAGGGTNLLFANATQVNTVQQFNLSRREEALAALDQIDMALTRVSNELGSIGALQRRLETALGHLSSTQINYSAAASRITDIDVAAESSELVRRNILNSVTTAVLGQANLAPQLALLLIQGR